jgi:uncharacterized protein YkwD
MRPRGALSVVCLFVLFTAWAVPQAAARALVASQSVSTTRNGDLVAAINTVRNLHLLPGLSVDIHLARAARAHSRDMLRRQYFGHADFGARMTLFHVRGRLFAENLAFSNGVMSAKTAVAHWLASPEHRTILLDPSLRRIGVASPIGRFDGFARATMVTADFAG